MKAFNFDEPTERRGTGSYKWESADADVIPLWVADMDFRTAPCIIEALSDRVRHGVFGYEKVPDAWYEALAARYAMSAMGKPDGSHTAVRICTSWATAPEAAARLIADVQAL